MATLDLLDANDNLSDLQKAENSKQALEEIQTEKFYNTLKSITLIEKLTLDLKLWLTKIY